MKEHERTAIESLAMQLKGKQITAEQDRVEAAILSQDELLELARVELGQTVNPWAEEFVGSGLYEQIYQSLRGEEFSDSQYVHDVSLSRTFVHPWRGELYTARFFIRGDRYAPREESPTCYVQRRPLFGMNWVVAMGDRDRALRFSLTRPEELLVQAHPILILEFAEQIRDGTVWNVLERSLNRPPARIASEEDRREYHRSRVLLRDQFLAKWGNVT